MDPFAPVQDWINRNGWQSIGGSGGGTFITVDYQKGFNQLSVRIDLTHMELRTSTGKATRQPKTVDGGLDLLHWLQQNLK